MTNKAPEEIAKEIIKEASRKFDSDREMKPISPAQNHILLSYVEREIASAIHSARNDAVMDVVVKLPQFPTGIGFSILYGSGWVAYHDKLRELNPTIKWEEDK